MRAQACRWQGRNHDTLFHALAAMDELPAGCASWLQAAGLAATSAGNTNNAEVLVDLARALDQVEPTRDAVAAYLIALSRAGDRLLMLGHYQHGEKLHRPLTQLANHPAAQEPAVAGWIHRMVAFHALFRGDPATFTLEMLSSARHFGRAGDSRNECLQQGNAGYGYLHAGDYLRAVELLRSALDTATRNKLGNVITSVQVDLGHALFHLGETDEAVTYLREAAQRCRQQGIKRLEGPARSYMASALSALGDSASALREARRAVALTADHPPARAAALATLAKIELADDRPEAALRSSNRAMGQLQLLGEINEGESLVRLVYAESLLAAGQRKAARDAILVACQRLQQRAAHISDARFRENFLYSDTDNARTLSLADQLVPPADSR